MYDLKGCEQGREIYIADENDAKVKVQKDLNYIKNKEHLYLTQKDSENIKLIVKKDTKYLEDLELMDYSLFVVKVELKIDRSGGDSQKKMIKEDQVPVLEDKEIVENCSEAKEINININDSQYKKHIFKSTKDYSIYTKIQFLLILSSFF